LAIQGTNNFAAGKSYYDGNIAVNPSVPLSGTRIEAKDIGNELHIHFQTSKCLALRLIVRRKNRGLYLGKKI
jgi:hypothetical protein